MKTAYINPYGQSAIEIIHDYGNITNITETTQEINTIIHNTHNQRPKHVNTIKDLCYEKIRQYYTYQLRKNNDNYNYLFTQSITHADTIATHTLLQATAVCYGHNSMEADMITRLIIETIRQRMESTYMDEVIDNSLSDYLDIHNTTLTDILPLINSNTLNLNHLLLNKEHLILSYDDFMNEYSSYLEHRRPETIYQLLCMSMKKELLLALIERQTQKYIYTIESMLKQIEPAGVIREVGSQIKKIEQEQVKMINDKTGKNNAFTNYNDDVPTPYITEAFPPCVRKALMGTNSGGRNYAVSLFLTPFLSYARLYPGVYARHIKNPRIIDMDPTLTITNEEILPLIEQAAANCKPPLLSDQPEEKNNIYSKLGFGEANISYENCGSSPWYTPSNCKSIQQQQPQLCTPCKDCEKIGNPLSYYNRKRKLLSKKIGDTDATNGNKR